MSKVYILPNLRKGLAKHIITPVSTETDPSPKRASFEIKANLKGNKVGSEQEQWEDIEETKLLTLVGPVDIRTVNAAAVSEVVPADNSEGYSYGYMPYIEFYEEDFPWRYTPKPASDKLEPWLLLLACKDDEFMLTKDNLGFARVTVNLKGSDHFYPDTETFHQLAHVQVTVPDWRDVTGMGGVVDSKKVADYVVENPDDGISRLFCYRQLERKTRYTMFLVPAFELGRRAGAGESLEGAGIEDFSWTNQSKQITFPVYYQWSFKTGEAKFLELARLQNFISDDEFSALPDGLKADIQETGLKQYRLGNYKDEDKVLIDIPVALVKRGFSESNLAEEVLKIKGSFGQQLDISNFGNAISKTTEVAKGKAGAGDLSGVNAKVGDRVQATVSLKLDASVHMTDELKSLLLKHPVFSENGVVKETGGKVSGLSETEDPWVVPPVYGARHILAEKEDLDNPKLFLQNLNLRFRNRAAAGMGVSVVKRNQEVFTNRAWGMIEEINAQNQRIREFYEAVKTNGASSKKATSLRNWRFEPHASGLQADAAIRVANAQSSADVNAVDMAMDIALGNLSTRSSVLQPFQKAVGISKAELEIISNPNNWAGRWADIVKISYGYRCLVGEIPFFDSGIDTRFNFLNGLFNVEYPVVTLDNQNKVAIPWACRGKRNDEFFSFRSYGEPTQLPDLVKNYLAAKDIGWLISRFRSNSENVEYDLDQLLSQIKYAKSEYESKWGKRDQTEEYNTRDYSCLYQRCLPPKGHVYDDRGHLIGYAVYMREYEKGSLAEYPKGVRLEYMDTSRNAKTMSLYVLPAERFEDVKECRLVFQKEEDGYSAYPLVPNPDNPGFFMPEKSAHDVTDDIYFASPFNYRNAGYTFSSSSIDFGYNQRFCEIYENPVEEGGLFKLFKLASETSLGYGHVALDRSGRAGYGYDVTAGSDEISTVLLSLYKGRVKVELFYRVKGNDYRFYDFLINMKTCGTEGGTDSLCYTGEDGVIYAQMGVLQRIFKRIVDGGKWVSGAMWQPNLAILTEASLKDVPTVSADEIGLLEDKVKNMNEFYDAICHEAEVFHDYLQHHDLVPALSEEGTGSEATELDDEELARIDADKENEARLLEIASSFAERGMSVDLGKANFDGKYPIMAYPIFPDPTSFYLRELSERFILPSVDKLPMDSVSCFVTNPIFEEAFLAGMNTEMGRELLWREYPTDERGSYFRKFWDQVDLSNDFSKDYFDVKYLHDWKKQLGNNHEDGKGQLVVFVIKSKLMTMYPQTGVTLSSPQGNILNIVLEPTMTGWLSDDTFMAGFDISKLESTSGLYLTFTETDKSQRFSFEQKGKNVSLSSDFAIAHKDDGSVWGLGIKPEYLVVNQLHFDDDDDISQDDDSGIRIPKPNGEIDHHLDQHDIRPDLKR